MFHVPPADQPWHRPQDRRHLRLGRAHARRVFRRRRRVQAAEGASAEGESRGWSSRWRSGSTPLGWLGPEWMRLPPGGIRFGWLYVLGPGPSLPGDWNGNLQRRRMSSVFHFSAWLGGRGRRKKQVGGHAIRHRRMRQKDGTVGGYARQGMYKTTDPRQRDRVMRRQAHGIETAHPPNLPVDRLRNARHFPAETTRFMSRSTASGTQ